MYADNCRSRFTMKWVTVCLTVVVLVALQGCKSVSPREIYSPTEWRDLLKQAGDWVPLPFPESAFRPGSIIIVTDQSIKWIDHLESCNYPADLLDPEKSRIPNISFNKAVDLGADAVIGYKGITAGPGFSRVSKASLEVKDHGVEYLRLIRLQEWMKVPKNKERVSMGCMQELAKPDRYLVTAAFRVTKATYTLYDEKKNELKLDVPLLKELLQLSTDVKYNVTADGKLVVEEPAYFAVRKAVRIGEDFDAREDGSADSKIEKIFFKSVPQR